MLRIQNAFKYFVSAAILLFVAQAGYADTRVKEVQHKLVEMGYNPGIVDGVWGKKTEAALNLFLATKGQTFDGAIDGNEFEILGISNTQDDWLTFNYNIHDSLPPKWISEFEFIIGILRTTLPIEKSIDQLIQDSTFNIYAWNGKIKDPFGRNMAGACICGNGQDRWMVLEIPEDEFKYQSLHRYSVIIHEYFHIYQIGLSNDNMQPKWLVEGGAKVIEEMVTQQYYGDNSLQNDLGRRDLWSDEVFTDPRIFETHSMSSGGSANGAYIDMNYAGSAFMLLALVNELQKEGKSEKEALRSVFRDFWIANRSANWKAAFVETFEMSVEDFYEKLSSYSRRDYRKILPSGSLMFQDIFK